MAEKEGVQPFCIPPHTSHRLQPLDVGVFGPVQHAWQKCCLAVLEETGESLARPDVVKEYLTAQIDAVDKEIILAAWRKSGIRPLNPNVFTEKDFAASFSSSINLPFPASFPGGPNQLTPPSDDRQYKENEGSEDMESNHPSEPGSSVEKPHGNTTPDRGFISPTHLPVLDPTTGLSCLTFPPLSALLNLPPQNAPHSPCLHHQEGGEPSDQSRARGQPSGDCMQIHPVFIMPNPILRQTQSMSCPVSRSASLTSAILSMDYVHSLEEQLAEAKRHIKELKHDKDILTVHCISAQDVVIQQQKKLYLRTKSKGTLSNTRGTTVAARVLTSEEGHHELEQLQEVVCLKGQQQVEETARKSAEEQE
jgi:hypothetical protein